MKKGINYKALMEEIRDIFLDEGKTTMRDTSWRDEDGWHSSCELECTKEQESEVVELVEKFFSDWVVLVVKGILNE